MTRNHREQGDRAVMTISLSGRVVEHDEAGCQDPAEFVALAKRCGYDGVNLRSRQLTADTPEATYQQLRAALADAGLGVSMINATVPSSPEEAEGYERMCRRAAELGCDILRVSFRPESIDAGRAACDTAARHGLRLVMQMHTGAVNETFAMAADWTAQVDRPNFGVNAEPGNHLMIGEAFDAENLRRLGDRLFIVSLQSLIVVDQPGEGVNQLKLSDGTPVLYKRVPLGENAQLDVAAMGAALREVGYEGAINVLEPYPAGEDLETFCRNTCSFLRSGLGG